MDIVGTHFRPEFINRIDETIVFKPLGQDSIRKIAVLQLQHLNQRLNDKEMGIRFSEDALDLLSKEGFDPVYGARPLKRTIQYRIENPLAHKLLSGEFVSGDEIAVNVVDGKIAFSH
jgi:ATP-dependent Clp protease ATP-binding subunit ClpB